MGYTCWIVGVALEEAVYLLHRTSASLLTESWEEGSSQGQTDACICTPDLVPVLKENPNSLDSYEGAAKKVPIYGS